MLIILQVEKNKQLQLENEDLLRENSELKVELTDEREAAVDFEKAKNRLEQELKELKAKPPVDTKPNDTRTSF